MSRNNTLTRAKKRKAAEYLAANNLDKAYQLYKAICEKDRSDIEAWATFGAIAGQLGHYHVAVDACSHALKLMPNHVGLLINLGTALKAAGQWEAARSSYQRALDHNPTHTEGLLLMGNLHAEQGRAEEAQHYYRRAIESNPNNPAPYNNLGKLMEQVGDLAAAESAYRDAISVDNKYTTAYINAARLFAATGKLDAAIEFYELILEHKPGESTWLLELGDVYHRAREFAQAEQCYRQSLSSSPTSIETHLKLATLLNNTGRLEQAGSLYIQALRLAPRHPDALSGLASLELKRGNFAEAWALVQRLRKEQQLTPNAAVVEAMLAHRYNAIPEAITDLEDIAKRGELTPDTKQTVYLGLVKLLEQQGQYREAFMRADEARRLTKSGFDIGRHEALVSSLAETFSEEFMRETRFAVENCSALVFVVGMPRSGTTLVEQILASHPKIAGAGERKEISALAAPLNEQLLIRNFDKSAKTPIMRSAHSAALNYLHELRTAHPMAYRITDKTPINYLHLGLISMLYPQARVIHCRRNPMDTCLSCYFHNFVGKYEFTHSLRTLGQYYRLYERLLDHWEATVPIPLLTIEYEQLIKDFPETAKAMIDFCDLAWDEACARFYESGNTVLTASTEQVRRPIYGDSVGRHRNYREYLQDLESALNGN